MVGVAKRTRVTFPGGAVSEVQAQPADSVWARARHRPAPHGVVPSTQPTVGDTKVTDAAKKPAGTGPPEATALDGAVVSAEPVVELDAGAGPDPAMVAGAVAAGRRDDWREWVCRRTASASPAASTAATTATIIQVSGPVDRGDATEGIQHLRQGPEPHPLAPPGPRPRAPLPAWSSPSPWFSLLP